MARYSKSQLNAISYSITERENKKAKEFLNRIGIDYNFYCKKFGWKASASRLETKVWDLLYKLYREMGIYVSKAVEEDRERVLRDFECDYNTYCYSYKKEIPYFYFIDEFHIIAIDFKGNLYHGDDVEEYL